VTHQARRTGVGLGRGMVDVQTVAYHRWHDWSGSPLAPASVGDSGCGGWEAHLKIHAAPVMPRARHRARHRAPQCSGQPHHPSQGRGVGHSVRSCEALKYSRFYGCQYVARVADRQKTRFSLFGALRAGCASIGGSRGGKRRAVIASTAGSNLRRGQSRRASLFQ
jgi:hypothetical protein